MLGLFIAAALTAWLFFRRQLDRPNPVASVRVLADARVAVGCTLNFALGFGFFGATYLMPVFLALVRDHDALEIGRIMLVTGLAQLAAAPVVVVLEKRLDARLLSAFGFALFAIGLAMSGFETRETDYDAIFVPQVIRGIAIMFCLAPPTRIALGHLALADIPNASGLFNVARNLGGAIGLALVDTVIYGRAPVWGETIKNHLLAGDVPTARAVGISIDAFLAARGQPIDNETRELLAPWSRSSRWRMPSTRRGWCWRRSRWWQSFRWRGCCAGAPDLRKLRFWRRSFRRYEAKPIDAWWRWLWRALVQHSALVGAYTDPCPGRWR